MCAAACVPAAPQVFDEEGEEYDAAERRRLERQEKLAAKKQQRLLQHVSTTAP